MRLPALFESMGFGKTTQRQACEVGFRRGNACHALGQTTPPAFPALAGKVRKNLARVMTRLPLLGIEAFRQSCAERSLGKTETLSPFLDHLAVAHLSQTIQQLLASVSQVTPFAIRIQLGKTFGKRAAAAECDAQIVYRLRRQAISGQTLFLSNAAQRTL